MAEQLYPVIVAMIAKFDWLKDAPVYIAGESYASKYIPRIAHYIHTKNEAAGSKLVNLAGIAIGNGIGDMVPYVAYESTPDYLRHFGLIDAETQAWAHGRLAVCKQHCDREEWAEAYKVCEDMSETLLSEKAQVPFIYDIRATTDVFSDLSAVTAAWINDPAVHKALNAGGFPWRQSDGQGPSSIGKPVPDHLESDQLLPIPTKIITDLMEKYQFMTYSGQYDGSPWNFLGSERLIDQLEWKGKAAYNASARVVWKVDGEVAGYMKGDVAGFSYVLATNCGHLVPTDQPKNALDLIRRFIKREPFA